VVDSNVSRSGLPAVLDRLAGLETRHRDRSLEALRTALLGGDRDAWRLIVEKYSRFVYTVALRLLAGTPQPEEAAASIYARIFERLESKDFRLLRNFRGGCRFTSYLYRMVQSERKEYLRTKRAYADRRVEEWTSEPPAVSSAPDTVLRPDLVREAVAGALDRLAPPERILLLCRFRDGLKLREIAELFGFKDSSAADRAVRSALARLDLLKELNRKHRLGEAEYAVLERALHEQLFGFEQPGEGGG
jgi:RNA polymerase sigma-70 factor (ECF subfamily)